MPGARNLIEAYNYFVVEPLKTEKEFEDFYVDRLLKLSREAETRK